MYEYVIEGGYPIQGTITASGNKNAALPCLAATLLTKEPVILHNIPEIQDTNVMIEILKSLGAKVEKLSKNNWKIQCENITTHELPRELTKKVRGSIVFAGPLIARLGKCEMPICLFFSLMYCSCSLLSCAYLKAKVEAGAKYVVTQMFFDNSRYFSFVERCREAGITVPIIPGIKPLTSLTQQSLLPKTFHIDLPEDLAREFRRCKSNDDVKALGVEWGIAQARELKAANVASIHFYSMNAAASIEAIAKAVY